MSSNLLILMFLLIVFWFVVALGVLKSAPEDNDISQTDLFIVSALWPIFAVIAIGRGIYRAMKR